MYGVTRTDNRNTMQALPGNAGADFAAATRAAQTRPNQTPNQAMRMAPLNRPQAAAVRPPVARVATQPLPPVPRPPLPQSHVELGRDRTGGEIATDMVKLSSALTVGGAVLGAAIGTAVTFVKHDPKVYIAYEAAAGAGGGFLLWAAGAASYCATGRDKADKGKQRADNSAV